MLRIKRGTRRAERSDVIDLREHRWEYDVVQIPHGPDGEPVIQRLLVGRAGAGWDVDRFAADADWYRFVFRRPDSTT